MPEASPGRHAPGAGKADIRAEESEHPTELKAPTAAGSYRILGRIGAGGMGEVYRAEDLVLKRQVALKVLPTAVVGDPDRLARFRREAEVLASLNHPHICTLHAIGASRPEDLGIAAAPGGAPTATHPFLVMELIEGRTLAARLEKGPLPPALVCQVGAQIADALAAAHNHGVVHRDLKPANVMLAHTGAGPNGLPHVKLLDFGLAKLVGRGARPTFAVDSEADTQVAGLTGEGAVLGTLPYMAPEQVEGHDADARTDIWALGAVLYEMVTGTPAFAGDSSASLAGRILTAEPAPMQARQPLTPAALDRVVRRCLAKSPDERWASAHDVAEELRWIAAGGAPASGPEAAVARPWRKLKWGFGLAAAIGIVTTTFILIAPPLADHEAAIPAKDGSPLHPAATKRNVVAVALFVNRTGDPELDDVGLMAADWTTDGLTQISGADVALPPSSALGAASANREARAAYADPRQVGEATRATLVVSGEYHLEGDAIVFLARVSERESGRVLAAVTPSKGPRRDPVKAAEAARRAVVAAVAYHLDTNFELRAGRVPSLDAYREMALAVGWWYRDWDRVIYHLERALTADPEYLEAQLLLVGASIYTGNFEHGERILDTAARRDQGLTEYERLKIRLQRAFLYGRREEHLAAAVEMIRLAPGVNSQGIFPPFEAGCMLYFLNRPNEAADLIAAISTRPVYAWAFPEIRLHTLHLAGRFDEQYALASQACNRHPAILYFREHQAAALAAKGDSDGVNRVVGETLAAQAESGTPGLVMLVAAMELRAHGHRPEADALAARAAGWYARQSVEKFAALQTPNRGVAWYLNRPPDIRRRLREEHAMALELTGRWEDVRAIVRELHAADPASVDYLGWGGVLAARRGDRDEARRVAGQLQAAKSRYLYGSATYWRASIAAHLGEKREAVDLLSQALSEGLGYQTQLHRTLDLEPLWGYPPFIELLRPKG